jgi:hypothetical protein
MGYQPPNPPTSQSDSDKLISTPMPPSHRRTIQVYTHAIRDLKNDLRAMKRRASAIPYQFTIGWSALSIVGACVVGIVIYDNSQPKPGHSVWLMYFTGAVSFGVAALFCFAWWWRTRKSHHHDVDDCVEKIEQMEYDAPEGENA